MRARDAVSSDHEAIRGLHDQMGLDYKFPDLAGPRVLVAQVIEDEHGRIVGALALRMETEAMLWLDMGLPKRVRWKAIQGLARACLRAALAQGIGSVTAWIPESALTQGFSSILTRLGFLSVRSGWHAFVKEID